MPRVKNTDFHLIVALAPQLRHLLRQVHVDILSIFAGQLKSSVSTIEDGQADQETHVHFAFIFNEANITTSDSIKGRTETFMRQLLQRALTDSEQRSMVRCKLHADILTLMGGYFDKELFSVPAVTGITCEEIEAHREKYQAALKEKKLRDPSIDTLFEKLAEVIDQEGLLHELKPVQAVSEALDVLDAAGYRFAKHIQKFKGPAAQEHIIRVVARVAGKRRRAEDEADEALDQKLARLLNPPTDI